MRILVYGSVLVLAVLITLAVVFRSKAAWDLIHLGRRILWMYAAMIVALAAYEVWQRGL